MPDGGPILTVLITGFKPFEDSYNISEAVIDQLHLRATTTNVRFVTAVLSNDYLEAEMRLKMLVETVNPDYIIALGEVNGAKTSGIQIETEATGDSDREDPSGIAPACLRDADQTDRLIEVRNPVLNEAIVASFNAHKLDGTAYVDKDAGDYLCNDIFYQALRYQAIKGKDGHVIFLHLNDPNDPSEPLRDMEPVVKSYCAVVDDTVRFLAENRETCMRAVELTEYRIRNTSSEAVAWHPPMLAAAASVPTPTPEADASPLIAPTTQMRLPAADTDEILPPLAPRSPQLGRPR